MAEGTIEVVEPPKMPQVSVKIFFGPHDTLEDARRMRMQFEEADIYIPEYYGWREDDLETTRLISDGDKEVLDYVLKNKSLRAFSREKLIMVFNSHKPIAFADVPFGNNIAVRLSQKKAELLRLVESPILKGGFRQTLNTIREFWKEFGELEVQRDKYILSQIKPTVEKLLEDYPALKDKQKLNIFMSLGSIHSAILKMDRTLKREDGGRILEYSFPMEAARKGQIGEAIDDELAAKVFLDTYFSKELSLLEKSAGEDSEERIKLRKKIVSCFNLQDAEDMFDSLREGENPDNVFLDKLRQKEMDEFLSRPLLEPKVQV